jgi:dTDP-4-dehydrorhamnose reductase
MKDDQLNTAFAGTILVTGAGGQLGMELWKLSGRYPSCKFLFKRKEELPLDDFKAVKNFFEKQQVHHCINCAAYTAVDKAESEKEKAFLINGDAAGNLATLCKAHQARLIHISTDYVFDGKASRPYTEEDRIAPINAYGASKLRGEDLILNHAPSSIIIRTSWLYSSFGNNFVKTMVRLLKERSSINVVDDQHGSPTYAADLANAIMTIIEKNETEHPYSGIFNYCNMGETTWYKFAKAIRKYIKSKCEIEPIPTSAYPTPAKRPQYSVLDTTRIRESFGISIPEWKESLHTCLSFIT